MARVHFVATSPRCRARRDRPDRSLRRRHLDRVRGAGGTERAERDRLRRHRRRAKRGSGPPLLRLQPQVTT
eukprot:5878394-Pyramimonas_sp.AAC.1